MQHDQFIGRVQDRAKLASRGDAERATRATLETLGERIPGGLAENIAGQLPQEIGEHLCRTGGPEDSAERFDVSGFITRVRDRAGGSVDEPQAVYLARVVFEITDEATQGRLAERVREALPEGLEGVLSKGSTDTASQ
ncbi:MAG: DUF2267 domain-containing protein [Actinophytocola sp.]|nr:DUF2267 domain-containing protein [Actinophytocola sp.]